MDLTLDEMADALGGRALLVRLVELHRENAALRAALAQETEAPDAQPAVSDR